MVSLTRILFSAAGSGGAAGATFNVPFIHNSILRGVFSAPISKVAISVEQPGAGGGSDADSVQHFTYGQLQQDVLSVALRVLRPMAVPDIAASMKRPPIKSPYHPKIQGAVDPMDGTAGQGQNVGVLAKPGYEFVVSLLATWALNLTAVPICHTHTYDPEIKHVLTNSDAGMLLVDHFSKSSGKLPDAFFNSETTPPPTGGADTCNVKACADITEALRAIDSFRADKSWKVELIGVDDDESATKSSSSADELLGKAQKQHDKAAREERRRRQEDAAAIFTGYMMPSARDSPTAQKEHADFLSTLPDADVFARASAHASTDADCLMIHTSGTTNKPKGAVHTHRSISNQVDVLRSAWEWSSHDTILNVLPMHHVHGLVNVLCCAMASQATCIISPFDNSLRIAKRLQRGDISLFMGVPTNYVKIEDAVRNKMSPIEQRSWRTAMEEHVRLMVSGSSALPKPVLDNFHAVSGHTLLERYGMTEIGMCLSQPLEPTEKRVPMSVGQPLPTVRAYVDESGELDEKQQSHKDDSTAVGTLMANSPSLFSRYWNNPTATAKEVFAHPKTSERFFNTGDTVSVVKAEGLFSILGRSSVDIIKRSGFKLSALEIEAELLLCEAVKETAVLGVANDKTGEEVCALVVLRGDDESLIDSEVKPFVEHRLAHYKRPSHYVFVREALKRNATGKINKKQLKAEYKL